MECANSLTGPLTTKLQPNGLSRNLYGMREFCDGPTGHKNEAECPVTNAECANSVKGPLAQKMVPNSLSRNLSGMREVRDRPIGQQINKLGGSSKKS